MKQSLAILSLFVLTQAFSSPSAKAQSTTPSVTHSPSGTNGRPHVGVLLGVGDRIGEMGAGFNYGLDGGIELSAPWSIGLQINSFKSSIDYVGSSFSIQRWSFLPKITYNFGGDTPVIKESYAGLKFGAVVDRSELTTPGGSTSDSITRLAVAPTIGFDIPVMNQLSAGLELSYLWVFGPEDNNDSVHALGALKYWF